MKAKGIKQSEWKMLLLVCSALGSRSTDLENAISESMKSNLISRHTSQEP